MAELAFAFSADGHRYSALKDGTEVAWSEVDTIGGTSLLVKHTEVAVGHEGHGYGSALVGHLLDEVRTQGRTVMPLCPFAANYMRNHPETLDLVRPSYRAAMR
jgi:predicted GNAT family acetyltransferase